MPGFNQVSPLKIDRELRKNCQIFRLCGIFDIFSAPAFRSRLYPAIAVSVEEGLQNVILDFTDTGPIDRYALEVLVELGQEIHRQGGRLQIVGSPRLVRLIQQLRLEQFLLLQSNLNAAIENVESESDTEGRQAGCGI